MYKMCIRVGCIIVYCSLGFLSPLSQCSCHYLEMIYIYAFLALFVPYLNWTISLVTIGLGCLVTVVLFASSLDCWWGHFHSSYFTNSKGCNKKVKLLVVIMSIFFVIRCTIDIRCFRKRIAVLEQLTTQATTDSDRSRSCNVDVRTSPY